MASIDLTDAYYTVPVASEHRKYLRFIWGGKLFQCTCLSNGLSAAPRYFTKLLKQVEVAIDASKIGWGQSVLERLVVRIRKIEAHK